MKEKEIKIYQNILKELIRLNPKTRADFNLLLRKTMGKNKVPPTSNITLLKAYRQLVKAKKIKYLPKFEKLLQKREIRTLSGVAPIAVLTKPHPCPGKCAFCPSEKEMPKSYLSNEPAVMRAILNDFNPYKQVKMRLRALNDASHDTDKIELIVMGGTWSYLPKQYQTWFLKECFDAFNSRRSKNLAAAQKLNEKSKHRVVGLTLETRPDYITKEEIKRIRQLGCTRVEIGVQTIDDKILKYNNRGHGVKEIVQATRLLKQAGFKIAYHMMPNMPSSTVKKDLEVFKKLFTDERFQPDMIKIYPCVVTKDSKIYQWYKKGKYKPYTDKQLLDLLIKIKKDIPEYVRIIRLIRDIPSESIIAGNKISNLRQLMQAQGAECRCIRCREVRGELKNIEKSKYKQIKYKASNGTEYFLSFNSPDDKLLYAFLRLRLPKDPKPSLNQVQDDALMLQDDIIIPELIDAAIIREVHTYGKLAPLSGKTKSAQHIGFGKQLVQKAEQIAKKQGFKKMAVISGIGVREYYRKLGYTLEGTYMVKDLK